MSKPPVEPSPEAGSDCDPLYQAAVEVERDETLAAEMAEWEEATLADGCPGAWPGRPGHGDRG